MFQVERQEKIVQILEERPRVTVEELAKQLGVTAMTIRRDLKYLESVQIVSRTFGGAVLKSKLTLELPRQEKEMQHQAEKERIASAQALLMQLESPLDAVARALDAARALRGQGWELLPVMSFAAGQDTRFGRASGWRHQLEGLTGRPVLDTLQAVEPLGPRHLADALVIAPCTGATLARLAEGLSDTPVTLAAKSLLRVGCPVVIAVSTNDGLGASGENIARLYQRKHYYFVPYGQDDPTHKPNSLKADFARLPAALDAALAGRQLQPVLLQNNV